MESVLASLVGLIAAAAIYLILSRALIRVLLGIMLRALWMCVTKKVTWRGTAYQHVMAAKLPDAKPSEVSAAERTL